MDTEIRKVGAPIVLGTIPGVIAIVGCSNFPEGADEVAEIAEEFAKRKYIVVLSGCAAMAVGMKKDKDGKTLYEKYSPNFEAGGVINVGLLRGQRPYQWRGHQDRQYLRHTAAARQL